MATSQPKDLQGIWARALSTAQALEPWHANRCIHGGLHPETLEFLADGSLRWASCWHRTCKPACRHYRPPQLPLWA